MKILLYGINYSPELTGIGKYSGEMAQWLASNGHEVQVITAPPYYPEWNVKAGFSSRRWRSSREEGVRVLRCPIYVPARPNAIKRFVHLGSFALSSLIPLLSKVRWRPDLVVLVAPTLFCAPGALLFARLSGARSVVHIQDYEVDALFGLGIASGGVMKRLAYAAERLLLRSFDLVSTISPGMLRRAQDKGVNPSKLVFFPNWAEIERFQNVPFDISILRSLGVPEHRNVLLYSGNIGEKQGLEQVIEAADILRNRQDLFFLIVGEGAGKSRLVELASQRKLNNVIFAPLQPYEDLPRLLATASVHLVVQKRGAADAVLPSKLTNILAVGGNAVITADPDTSLGQLCLEHKGIAALVEPESVESLIDGIETALGMRRPNDVALRYAREFLDKKVILERFVKDVSCG